MQNILTEGTAALLISYFTISGNILALKAGGNKLHLRPQISWGMCSSTFLAAAWLICHEKYVIAVWYNTWEKTPRLDKFVYKSNLVSYNEMCLVQMNLEAIFFFFLKTGAPGLCSLLLCISSTKMCFLRSCPLYHSASSTEYHSLPVNTRLSEFGPVPKLVRPLWGHRHIPLSRLSVFHGFPLQLPLVHPGSCSLPCFSWGFFAALRHP